MLVRLLLNRATRAQAGGQGTRRLTLYRRMTVKAPVYIQAWWDCARLDLVDGDVEEARRSLNTILELTRQPASRAWATGLLTLLTPG